MQANQLKFVRRTLYSLKRRYGAPADVHHILRTVDNTETGKSTTQETSYHIRKVIVLPTILTREFTRVATNLTAQEIDIDTRLIIIDSEDLPTELELTVNDYILIREVNNRSQGSVKRYNILKTQELEDDIGLLITAKYIR